MDLAASSSSNLGRNNDLHSSHRPAVPPKPRSSTGSIRNELEGKPGLTTSTVTVGTQVNLLVKRRTKEIDPGLSPTKPVIPPKPSTKTLSPKRSLPETNTEPSIPETFIKSEPSPSATTVIQPQYFGIPDPKKRIEAQRKSTSLGRHSLFFPTSPPPYQARVSHLDLTSSPSQWERLFLPGRISSSAPPPPPRRRHSQKLPPSSTTLDPLALARHASAPVSPSFPIYAVVDKDKKWQERRIKEEMERLTLDPIQFPCPQELVDNPSVGLESIETCEVDAELPSEEGKSEPISPSEPNSWLGKFISKDEPPQTMSVAALAMAESVAEVLRQNNSFLFNHNNPVTTDLPNQKETEPIPDQEIEGEAVVTLVQLEGTTLSSENQESAGVDEPDRPPTPSVVLTAVTESDTSTDPGGYDDDSTMKPSDAHLVYEIVRSQAQFQTPSSKKSEELEEQPEPILPQLITRESFRRRSWTCSEHASSFTESSPTSSSSGSLRERTISVSGSINSHSHSQWADEGELSTGALGDAENSDACQADSVEDFSPSSSRTPSSSSGSRPKRLVNSIFNSFGKGGAKKLTAMRSTPQYSSSRRKEKSRSHFFFDAMQIPHNGKKSKSEVYLHRGNAVRSILGKESYLHAHLSSPQEDSAEPTPPAEAQDIVMVATPEKPDVDEPTPQTLQCYDDVLSGLTGNKERQAFYVAREILTSERTFVDVLNLLTVDFPKFVTSTETLLGHPIITRTSLDSVFGGLPNLKLVNESLIHDLEERLAQWRTTPKVSDIIIKTGPFLKHYSGYIRDYQKISQRFDHICDKNPHFAKVVTEFEKLEGCKNLKLKHFMLKPVQRMPQYALLLGDYLKNLEPCHEDYNGTVEAIKVVKEVAHHGNEAIRLQINAEKLIQLQKRLSQNVILKSDRQLICEGELRKVCRKELQPRYFALMSDCLLCMTYAGAPTGAGSKELKLRYELPLTGMRVAIATNEDYQNEFSVISVARSFNLVAKTHKERNDWLKSLNVAIKTNIKKRAVGVIQEFDREPSHIGKEAPVWIADGRVTMCQSCTAEFTMTFRRHHCRACGKVVCGNCSGNEAPLQYLNFEAARVCDECYTPLMEEFDLKNRQNSQEVIETIRNRFKKGTPSISKRGAKHKKSIPTRLEIHGSTSGSAMSGYLNWREGKKAWRKNWFALLERVLYIYAASEDIAAMRGIPILGYEVELVTGSVEDDDVNDRVKCTFQLTHSGQDPYVFEADNSTSAKRWIAAMKEGSVMT